MKKKHLSFSKWVVCFALTAGLGFSSCSDDDTKYDTEIDKINEQLASLKSAIEKIQQSYVSKITDGGDGKTLTVTMHDGSTQTLTFVGTKGDTGATGESTIITMDSATGNWFINGVDSKVSYKGTKGDKGDTGAAGEKGDKGDTGAAGEKGDKGDTGAAGGKGDKGDTGAAGTGTTVTVGTDGYLYINGEKTNIKENTGGSLGVANSVLVVEGDKYFTMTIVDADGKETSYKLPKATRLVTSLEFVPSMVNDKDVKIIVFPYIFQDFYRHFTEAGVAGGTNTTDFVYNNTWSAGTQGVYPTQTYALKYAQDALVKYRVNPASVNKDAFNIKGFSLEEAVVYRSFQPSSALTISDSTYTTVDGQTLLTLRVKAPALPNAGSTTKTDMVSLVVENTNAVLEDGQESSLVYSPYIPAKRMDYVADLVKKFDKKDAVAADRNNYEDSKNYGYIPNRHYQILHPTMTDAEVNIYNPFVDVPALTDTNAAVVVAALKKVRNFTYQYDNKGDELVLSKELDAVIDTETNAKSTTWMDDRFLGANDEGTNNKLGESKASYKWNFQPVKFKKDDAFDNTADKYMNLDTTTGKVTIKKPQTQVEGQDEDVNYAAINRMLVVRANLQDTAGNTLLSRIVLIHVVGETPDIEPTVIRIKNQTVLVPGCDETGRLDMDAIFNHSTVKKDKATFNKAYTIFNGANINGINEVPAIPADTKITYVDPTTGLKVETDAAVLGVTVTDARVVDNVVKIGKVNKLLPGVTYDIYGTYQGAGVPDVNVVWEFTVIRPTLPVVEKYKTLSLWKTLDGVEQETFQAGGRNSRILNQNNAWDETANLKNGFKNYAKTYTLQNYVNGAQVDGDCGDVVIELGFVLLNPTTLAPYQNADPGVGSNVNWINRRYANYFITHYVSAPEDTEVVTLIPSNTNPNASVLTNGTVQFSFTNLELYYNGIGRSYVGYSRWNGETARLVPVQAVAYLGRDYTHPYELNFANNEKGLDNSTLAKFNVDFNNPVQPIVGKDGKAAKGEVFLIDRTPSFKADLSKLFGIQDEAGRSIYDFGAVLSSETGTTVGTDANWNMDLVRQYKVGYDLSSDLGSVNADTNPFGAITAFENNNYFVNNFWTTQGSRVKYEAIGIVLEPTVAIGQEEKFGEFSSGSAKCEIDQVTGLATWVNPGEILQNPVYIRFKITVPNQWNWGEYNGVGGTVNTVTNNFNTAQYISTYVNVPLVPQSTGVAINK